MGEAHQGGETRVERLHRQQRSAIFGAQWYPLALRQKRAELNDGRRLELVEELRVRSHVECRLAERDAPPVVHHLAPHE